MEQAVLPTLWAEPRRRLRVEGRRARRLEVRNVASHDRHAVHQCGRRDQRVSLGTSIRSKTLCTPVGDSRFAAHAVTSASARPKLALEALKRRSYRAEHPKGLAQIDRTVKIAGSWRLEVDVVRARHGQKVDDVDRGLGETVVFVDGQQHMGRAATIGDEHGAVVGSLLGAAGILIAFGDSSRYSPARRLLK